MPNVKTSDETAAGALTGTEIVRIVQSAADVRTTTQAIANLAPAGGSGLYSQVLSALPTIASTGFSTWLNQQSATITDGQTGLILAGDLAGTHISGRTKSPPATPYNIDILIDFETLTNNPTGAYGPMFGWTDGTKIQALTKFIGSGGTHKIFVLDYATVTSGASAAGVHGEVDGTSRMQWLRISDDGTTVSFSVLPGGSYSSPVALYTVAKASGYLGASGYSSIFYGINRNAGQVSAALLSYMQR